MTEDFVIEEFVTEDCVIEDFVTEDCVIDVCILLKLKYDRKFYLSISFPDLQFDFSRRFETSQIVYN